MLIKNSYIYDTIRMDDIEINYSYYTIIGLQWIFEFDSLKIKFQKRFNPLLLAYSFFTKNHPLTTV